MNFGKNPFASTMLLVASLMLLSIGFTYLILQGDKSIPANIDVYLIVITNQIIIGLILSLAMFLRERKSP